MRKLLKTTNVCYILLFLATIFILTVFGCGTITPTTQGDNYWREVGSTGETAFLNSWSNYGLDFSTCAFKKDSIGYIHLKGYVANTALTSSTIFTLPAEYRPNKTLIFPYSTNYQIQILSDGSVNPGVPMQYVSLDGIIFYGEH